MDRCAHKELGLVYCKTVKHFESRICIYRHQLFLEAISHQLLTLEMFCLFASLNWVPIV